MVTRLSALQRKLSIQPNRPADLDHESRGAQVDYNYDKIGRVTSVSGANCAGVSRYVNNIS